MDQAFAIFDEITDALADYFNGIHEGDVDKLQRVFHADARLYSATAGDMVKMELSEYMDLVRGRPSPASQGAQRTDRIISIDTAGPASVAVKVELSVPPKHFTDLLTLLHVDRKWRIISKIFHYEIYE